jgi:hypothetical protein
MDYVENPLNGLTHTFRSLVRTKADRGISLGLKGERNRERYSIYAGSIEGLEFACCAGAGPTLSVLDGKASHARRFLIFAIRYWFELDGRPR